ncbi:MAG: hypothetical protein KDD61_12485 [Bdellovibrionales bacterium]|nr:hypothetical protein [Bdellovibrionales bacterium]
MNPTANERHHLRFHPDPNTLCWIDDDLHSQSYENGLVGLTINESASGCSAVFLQNDRIAEGKTYRTVVGRLSEVMATIRWIRPLDDSTVRVGIEYQDR